MNRTKINQKANKELHKLFWNEEIFTCEIRLPGCLNSWMLNYCHRHPRRYYYDKPDELLWSKNQVLLGCQKCHEILDKMSKEKKEEIFLRLRGEE